MWITFVKNTQADDYPQIERVATGGSYDSETNAYVPLPAGIVPGERLLIVLAAGSSVAITPPSGWTPIATSQQSLSVAICERTATGTEGSTATFSFSNTAPWASVALGLSGVVSRSNASFNTGTSPSPDPPAQSWSSGSRNSLALAIGVVDFSLNPDAWSADPAGYSAVATSRPASGGQARASVRVAQRQLPDISSENPGAFGISASALWYASTLLLSSTS